VSPGAHASEPVSATGALPEAEAFWRVVERFVESKRTQVLGVCAHGLGPLAADILERRGEPIPLPFLHEQRAARVATLTTQGLLARVSEVVAEPVLIFKGPEVAARYPHQARAFVDLDLLVSDARHVQRALLAAGFREEEDREGIFVGIHHLTPLRWPGLPLKIEVHMEPKWPEGLSAPRNAELFEAAVPTAVGVPNVLAPAPAHHALLIAAHAWAHQPLARVRDLLDVGALALEVERAELTHLAGAWGIAPVWQTTRATLDAVLSGRRTAPLRLWAGHVAQVREQTVLEQHLERLLSPFWGLPAHKAVRQATRALADEFRPASGERWPEKLRRSGHALRRPSASVATHRHQLGDSARRRRRRRSVRPPP
jgi:Uncharacterised nucleotidyltransferase